MLLNTSTPPFATQSNASTPIFPPTSNYGGHHIHGHDVHVNIPFVLQEIALGLIILFGIIGNVLVCYTVIKQNQIKHTTWYYLCSLSITDFLVCILNVPLFMYTTFDEDVINDGTFLCQFNGFFLVFFFLVSVLTLAVISVHKFLYIKHPLYWRSRNQSLRFLAGVWLLSLGIAIGPFIGWSKFSHVHGHKQCIPGVKQTYLDQSYLSVLLFVGFFLPLASIIFCYIFVFVATRKHHERLKRNSIRHGEINPTMRDWGIIKTIILVVLAFCLCWTPFVVYLCFHLTGTVIPLELSHAAFIMAYAQSALNPIIYALRHKLFREHFKSIICCSRYSSNDLGRDPSSFVTGGTAFIIERNTTMTKLVHYRRKPSTQQKNDAKQEKQLRTVPNKTNRMLSYSLSGEAFLKNSPPSYFNGVFQLSEE